MGTRFFYSAKKALTKRPSSSKATSNHPLRNDKSGGVLEGQYHETSKREDTATVRKGVSSRSGGGDLREKDLIRTQPPQPTREPTRMETTHPESVQGPSYRDRQNSMPDFRVLSKEKEGLQSQLSETQGILDTAVKTSKAYLKEITRLKGELQRVDSLLMSMVAEEKETGNKICDLEGKIRVQDEDIRNLKQRLRISEEQHSQTTKLLDDRTAELKGAQAFLTTADRYSGADIIKMAESLNAEIFQASALMAEMLVDAPVMEDSDQERQSIQKYKEFLDESRRLIGSQLFDHLIIKSSGIRVDPFPLQLAFQALFTWWCVYEASHFCEGPAGQSLKQIYKRIYESGKPFIRRHPDTQLTHHDQRSKPLQEDGAS